MFTFDSARSREQGYDELDAMRAKNLPDRIECGENDSYWMFVRRAPADQKRIELVSKQTGAIVAFCQPADAGKYGLNARQVDAARQALAL